MKMQVSRLSVLAFAAALACVACNKGEETSAAEPSNSPSAAEPSAASGETGSGIPECDAYLATMDKYITCDKVPQAARDATKQSLASTKQSWAALKGPDVPAASKQAAADGCKQGESALLQGAKAMGCTL